MTKSSSQPLHGRSHPDPTQLARALKALEINVPYYSARLLPGGRIEIVTRDGAQVWKPPRRRKPKEVIP